MSMSLQNEEHPLVPSLSITSDAHMQCELLKRLGSFFGCRHKGPPKSFPGSHPISVARHDLSRMQQETCMFSLKSDGVRYMLLLCEVEGQFRAVMIDRRLRLYEVVVWCDESFFSRGTLLDGELVLDHMRGQLTFQVFDAVRVAGAPCHALTYRDRLQLLHDKLLSELPEGMDERTEEAEEFIIDEKKVYSARCNHMRMRFVPKRFVTKENAEALWEKRNEFPFPSDGLIIHMNHLPIVSGTTRNVIKWKPHNVIDVVVDAEKKSVHCRAAGKEVPFNEVCFQEKTFPVVLSENHLFQCLVHRSCGSKRWLLECKIDLNDDAATLWPMRERIDKTEANDIGVIHATLQTISEAIAIEELLGTSSDSDLHIPDQPGATMSKRIADPPDPPEDGEDSKRKRESSSRNDASALHQSSIETFLRRDDAPGHPHQQPTTPECGRMTLCAADPTTEAGARGGAVSNTYAMPRDQLSTADLRRHCKALTMTPADTFGRGAIESFEAFALSDSHLFVPRFYGVRNFGRAQHNYTQRGAELSERATAFTGNMRNDQLPVVASARQRFMLDDADAAYPRGGLWVLPCGFGKTVLAIYVALRVVGRKCIVLVHKQGLLLQWCERIRAFAPGASVGILRQDQIDTEADILVAMIQTVARRDYATQLADRGLVIVDECHHLGAPVFNAAMSKLRCSFVLGLSATPERKDGLTDLLYHSMGTIIHRVEREKERVLVTTLVFDEREMHVEHACRDGRPCYSAMVNELANNSKRTKKIAEHVTRYLRSGRTIIVLSDRITQLETMKTQLLSAGARHEDIGMYVGKSSDAERERCGECAVMLSTFSMAREGLDKPSLDTLVLASPTSDVVQAIGRIQRVSGGTRKLPLVLDAADNFSLFEHMARKRRKHYRELGYQVQKLLASCDKGEGVDEGGCPLFI